MLIMPSCFYVYIFYYIYTLACWCNFFNTSQPTFLPSSSYLSSLHNRACCGLFDHYCPQTIYKLRNQNSSHCTTTSDFLLSTIFIFFTVSSLLKKCDEKWNPTTLKNIILISHISHVFLISLSYHHHHYTLHIFFECFFPFVFVF